MTSGPSQHMSRTGRRLLILALAIAVSLVPGGAATAEPRSDASTSTAGATIADVGPGRFSLAARPQSIVSGDPFTFVASAQFPAETEAVSMRFQLRHPTGRLIFQRTRNVVAPQGRTLTESFTRDTADLTLRPGTYPATMEARIRVGGVENRTTLETRLFVFAPESTPVPVVYAVRVGGQPLADPQGRFVSDPADFTRSRDEARAIASWVISDPQARVTLSLSPLLVEEWARIATGYELVGPEGATRFEAESPVAQEYASALASLRAAILTSRLELAATGYADPDISELTAVGLVDDVVAQYERGLSAAFASLETSPSTGTVPAGGCVPAPAIRHLRAAGVEYAIVGAECLEARDTSVTPTSYSVGKSGLVVLVADPVASRAAASADASALVGHAFERLIAGTPGPLTISIEPGPGESEAQALIACASALNAQPWTLPLTAREAATAPGRTADLDSDGDDSSAPRDYWNSAIEARRWSVALREALGDAAPESATAERDSLIAASSAWAGASGDWALADRGRGFAEAALRLSRDVLDTVSLTVEPITLAGTAGELPVTVSNNSGQPLTVRLITEASGGAELPGERERVITLDPQDNFVQIPVDLANAIAGDVRVSLVAGDIELSGESVTVRASYLDRIALIGGIVLVMIGFLVFIVRRVRAEESLEDAEETTARYTGRRTRRGTSGSASDPDASIPEEGPA